MSDTSAPTTPEKTGILAKLPKATGTTMAFSGIVVAALTGFAANTLDGALDSAERAIAAADAFALEQTTRRVELRTKMREAEDQVCGEKTGIEARNCWLRFYPDLDELLKKPAVIEDESGS